MDHEIELTRLVRKGMWMAFSVAILSIATYSVLSYTSQQRRAEAFAIEQAAETERTEERSQFWQKLVPWGKDEAE